MAAVDLDQAMFALLGAAGGLAGGPNDGESVDCAPLWRVVSKV